jgi:hypothetical protein
MEKRSSLGSLEVSAIGLGCMGLSINYGEPLDTRDRFARGPLRPGPRRQLPRHHPILRALHRQSYGSNDIRSRLPRFTAEALGATSWAPAGRRSSTSPPVSRSPRLRSRWRGCWPVPERRAHPRFPQDPTDSGEPHHRRSPPHPERDRRDRPAVRRPDRDRSPRQRPRKLPLNHAQDTHPFVTATRGSSSCLTTT